MPAADWGLNEEQTMELSVQALQALPGIGPSIARDLRDLGFRRECTVRSFKGVSIRF